MKLLGKPKLEESKRKYPEAKGQLTAWADEIERGSWANPNQLVDQYPYASVIGTNVVFNIKGRKFRLWTQIAFKTSVVTVIDFGPHHVYDRWEIKK